MTPEQGRAIKDAHTRLAQLPDYAGAIVVLFTRDFSVCEIASSVPDYLVRQVVRGLAEKVDPPVLILPAGSRRGGINGSG